jgi:phosphate transport system substrate-binding protein
MKKLAILAAFISSISTASQAGGDQIRVVGSSTVYPFTTYVAEQFGKKTGFKTPIVESTGTGAGFKLFCASNDGNSPDVTNASRRIKPDELLECFKNDVKELSEVKVGYDGIVVANSVNNKKFNLSLHDLFIALAKKVPAKDGKSLVDNTFKTWKEVNPDLPDQKIEVYGPPSTSGTRDSFVELVMEGGCWKLEPFVIAFPDATKRKEACHQIREDGAYIDSGENDNLIVQKLNTNKNALGIFGYSFLEENTNLVQGSAISGVEPTHESISDGSYIVSRPLFIYVKRSHIDKTKGLVEFIEEYVSDDAIAPFGYLDDRGLIPMPENELKKVQQDTLKGKLLQNLAEEASIAPAKDAAKLNTAAGTPPYHTQTR